ncbi:MAG: hypothetical protein V4563_07015 [Pseudomonadota bacterium]
MTSNLQQTLVAFGGRLATRKKSQGNFMTSSSASRVALMFWFVLASTNAAASPKQELQRIAFDVEVGQEMVHVLYTACEPHYRMLGFDPRFFVFFWDTARFDIYEGARLTLGKKFDSASIKMLVKKSMPSSPPTLERCERLVREDTPQRRTVPGVSDESLQQMRGVYLATNPDPHVARDKRLFNDCMKANFNSREVNFEQALQNCSCTLSAMHSVSAADLDDWFARARSGEDVPMPKQPWFPELLPKLQACLVR